MSKPFDKLAAFELFMMGSTFREIAMLFECEPIVVARAIGEIGDLNWRMFRGGVQ